MIFSVSDIPKLNRKGHSCKQACRFPLEYDAQDRPRRPHEITCYSVKYLAAHLKRETIETKLSLSYSTVRLAIRKLIKLLIIGLIHYIRPSIISFYTETFQCKYS